MVALGLALGASIAWGGSDFLAGLAARRLPVVTVLLLSQGAGLVLLLVLLAVSGDPAPPAAAVTAAAAAGLAEVLGFMVLYRSLAVGPMSVVAPISSLAAIVPVGFAVAGGELPSSRVAVGLGIALAGGVLDAGANVRFAVALTEGLASTVSVIGSLYPVTTIVLATIVLRERPRPVQTMGVLYVLYGVGLVTACGGA